MSGDLLEPPRSLPRPLVRLLRRFDTESGVRRLGWTIAFVSALGLLACVAKGANNPPDPRLEPPESSAPPAAAGRRPVEGFGEIAFRVSPPGRAGAGPDRCALLAETDRQRARGLMGRTDLAGYDGMIFRFPADTSGSFYMRNTPLPLSIAWFRADGTLVSTADMDPCGDSDDCPLYGPRQPYRYALEVPRGGLAPLGVVPGAVLTVAGACTAR